MSETVNVNDPIIAEMIAAGLMKAPDTMIVEIEADGANDPDAIQLDEPQSAALVQRVLAVGPEPLVAELTLADEGEVIVMADEGDLPDVVEMIEGLDEVLADESAATVEAAPADEGEAEVDFGALEQELAAQAAREEVYAEQKSEVGIVTPATTAPKSASSGTAPKREVRFAAGAAGSYVASVAGDAALEAAVNALPKKVKEKAANLIDFIHKGRTLSVFTRVAVDIMKVEGKLSNERLVRAFTTEASKRGVSEGYSIGTARSQAGQQIALFGRLGIAKPSGVVLVPNADSPLWQSLAGVTA